MHNADLHHRNQTLAEKLSSIFELRRTRSKINWDRGQYLDLLKAFGNPHLSLPPVIHVAGTNGKGSIISMLRAILEAAGLSVHSYTSPHLIHINERIQLAGQPIDDAYLEKLIDQALEYNKGAPLSFFEITTALAFRAFADTPADILLLEVGMGGELDCTNVIQQPICTIINRISMDHTDFLGNTIEEITRAKAGIIKTRVPCIVGHQGHHDQTKIIYETIKNKAEKENTILSIAGQEWNVSKHKSELIFTFDGREEHFPLPNLTGTHQLCNAGVVLATLEHIKDRFSISKEAIAQGLKNAYWPGRMHQISKNATEEIWLDCAHNDSAGEALAEQIKLWNTEELKDTHLIIGMLNSKNPSGFLLPLLNEIQTLHIVPIPHDENYLNAAQIAKSTDCSPLQHDGIEKALFYVQKTYSSPKRIIIAGSVYLAGYCLEHKLGQ